MGFSGLFKDVLEEVFRDTLDEDALIVADGASAAGVDS